MPSNPILDFASKGNYDSTPSHQCCPANPGLNQHHSPLGYCCFHPQSPGLHSGPIPSSQSIQSLPTVMRDNWSQISCVGLQALSLGPGSLSDPTMSNLSQLFLAAWEHTRLVSVSGPWSLLSTFAFDTTACVFIIQASP